MLTMFLPIVSQVRTALNLILNRLEKLFAKLYKNSKMRVRTFSLKFPMYHVMFMNVSRDVSDVSREVYEFVT